MSAKRLTNVFFAFCLVAWVAGCESTPVDVGAGDGNDNANTSDMTGDNGSDGSAGDDGGSGSDAGDGADGMSDGSGGENSGNDGNDNAGDTANDNGDGGVGDNANDNGTDNGNDNGDDGASDNGNQNDNGDDGMNDEMPASQTWSPGSQPCGGTQTNAFWFDSATRGYIGCGENAVGAGLYVTDDGGATWESQPLFNNTRINDIRRGPDGVLYATGTDAVDGHAVFIIDESGPVRQLVGLYQGSNSAFLQVSQGENIAITQDGQIMVDSLTGNQMIYRGVGDTQFTELMSFIDDGSSAQVSRIIAHNNGFWAAGGLINLPGAVYFPSSQPGATFELTKLELQPSTRDGEMHDIFVWSDTSALICGFDQSLSFPLIYRLDGDKTDLANWTKIELFNSGINYQGGAWKMSVLGDTVVMVGQTFPSNNGFVIRSFDRGLTWEDISPVDENGDFAVSLLTNVWLFEGGTILAAGEGGELWRFNP